MIQVISDSRPEIVANYVVWRAVMSALPYLHREARLALEDFERAMGKMRFVFTGQYSSALPYSSKTVVKKVACIRDHP